MPRKRHGFTLIELLVVVVIIGILAAIAIPKFQSTKGKANAATLKSDLRNLATAQEAYFYDYTAYTPNLALLRFRPSSGVTVTVLQADASGWAAEATHPLALPVICAIFIGGATPPPQAPTEGQIGCQ